MSNPMNTKYTAWKQMVHRWQARRDIPFRKRFFVGYDLHGNTYWEFTNDGNMQRLRRKLEPFKPEFYEADYFKSIPPQWLQWLRRTRNTPPSLQELVDDQVRQSRIKILAKQSDERWHMEKLRLDQEENMKLRKELEKVEREAKEFKQVKSEEADPWKLADESKDKDPIQSATIKPRAEEPIEDPWKQADESKDKDPIQSATIKPRAEEPIEDPWKQADESKDKNPIESASIKPRK
ncbi:uncharacterized protein J8A68_000677 [[Candida] subhashii]|uniref:NADH dehydrogenase [ubiquinone] 1 alpha subcomplex subunit n=1 Tax=[Candida] subhashii TaxID=561895 RepID=A0A8J5URU9_9ASCO|nr:uncharacterized protein J8A68_000677 [[Candida] subhashii]KAG7665851.1 hypothetical protein J8A68_000677 [[Candida] subhashii]